MHMKGRERRVREIYVYEKRYMYIKRDVLKKETYEYEKRYIYIKRGVLKKRMNMKRDVCK